VGVLTCFALLLDREYSPVMILTKSFTSGMLSCIIQMIMTTFVLHLESCVLWTFANYLNTMNVIIIKGLSFSIYGFAVYCQSMTFIMYTCVFIYAAMSDLFLSETGNELINHLGGTLNELFSENGAKLEMFIDEHRRLKMRISTNSRGLTEEEINIRMPLQVFKTPKDTRNQCAICQCVINNKVIWRLTPCDHAFHANCIDPWFACHKRCPMCNQSM
jgi:hypothetical protein